MTDWPHLQLLAPGRESLVPFVHVARHAGSSLPWNMHAEPGDSIPLRTIVLDKGVLGSGDLPHSVNCKESAGDIPDADALSVLSFS